MKTKRFFTKGIAALFATIITASVLPFYMLYGHADPGSIIANIQTFNYIDGSVQKYTVPETGQYIIEVAGASGGDSGVYGPGGKNYKGGNGGFVKGSVQLTKGDILYIYVGTRGDNNGGSAHRNDNGAGSGGGSSSGVRSGSGGGATEIRLNGTDLRDRLIVAGGGGGGIQKEGTGNEGGSGGAAGSGNTLFRFGANSPSGYGADICASGGGGGYYGGSAGSITNPSRGGSNYAASAVTVAVNDTDPDYANGSVKITQCTDYILKVDPNLGLWQGTKNIQMFTLDQTYNITKEFACTNTVQTWSVPYTGYYYFEGWGGSGGHDASRGGYGGYLQSYTYLKQGQTISIAVGDHGWTQIGTTYDPAHPGGYNGGANAGLTGHDDDYSGTGGGATHIALNNRNASGNNPLTGYASYKNEVLFVAGGGAGGSNHSSGQGGSVLYVGNGTDYPGKVSNGASTSLLNNNFCVGSNPGSYDGGGGGGGWVGGRYGLDYAGYSAGGGASFVNTTPISVNLGGVMTTVPLSIPLSLTPDQNSGSGKASIKYLSDTIPIPDPVRDGYEFLGWTLTGTGKLEKTNLGVTLFTYGKGLSTIKANWKKIPGSSFLDVDPNGGIYNDTEDTTVITGTDGKLITIPVPAKFGYTFTNWTYDKILSNEKSDNWSEPDYTFGYETEAKLTANWELHKSKLTIDPNGGLYEGSSELKKTSDLDIHDVVPISKPERTGYIFQYWSEENQSDGYLSDGGWNPGTKDGYLKAIWKPITYTVHYEPNAPEGLTVTGHHDDQEHVYDVEKALESNTEYDDPTGYKIKDVKFLWWNTKPDGSGTTYSSGQVVKNLTTKDKDVITLYAQWMVKYTVNHYTQELDGGYTLKNTDEYWLIPLTKWTPPLHEYPGFYQPKVEPQTVNTSDTIINLHYDLIHYKLSYDLQGGDWYEEQSDGSWINIPAPPSEYTVLTPDIHIVRPDKVGYNFTGWTGTDVDKETLDVVIPKGSLGDRSFLAHWTPQAYDVDVPVSLIFSMGDDGTVAGVFDQNGDGKLTQNGYVINKSLFPVQVTDVAYDNNGLFTNTYDQNLDSSHANIMNWRLNAQNGDEWNEYAVDLENGVSTSNNEMFWLGQKTSVRSHELQLSATNAWALHNKTDIKTLTKIGRIVWTFGIGDRWIPSRAITAAQTQ